MRAGERVVWVVPLVPDVEERELIHRGTYSAAAAPDWLGTSEFTAVRPLFFLIKMCPVFHTKKEVDFLQISQYWTFWTKWS